MTPAEDLRASCAFSCTSVVPTRYLIDEYAGAYDRETVGEGRNASRVVTRTGATRARVNPADPTDRYDEVLTAEGWVRA